MAINIKGIKSDSSKRGWICTAKDSNGEFYTVEHSEPSIKKVQKDFDNGKIRNGSNEPLVFVSAVSADNYHVCKYCGGIAEGTDEDVLCTECRMTFGHELFSML